jgi:hypothetical protein
MMKTSIALGAGLLVLSAALLLRNGTSDFACASKDALPSIEPEQSAKDAAPPRSNSHQVVPKPQTLLIGVDMLGAIEAQTDPDLRSQAFARAVELVSNAELPGMLDWLVRIESSAAAELREVLIRRWAETDGPAAAAWAARLEPGPASHDALTQVALGWAGADWSRVRDWAETLPEDERTAVTLGLGYEIARTDAVKALEAAASLGSTRQRDDLIEHAVSQWATTDFAAAVQWAGGNISDPGLRQRLLAAVAVAAAGQDGAAAAMLAATALAPGAEQDRTAVAIVQRWVQNEPEQAAAWVAQFPDTPARETTAQNLVAVWAAQDGEAAALWLRSLPAGTLRAAGMTAYAQTQLPAADFTARE